MNPDPIHVAHIVASSHGGGASYARDLAFGTEGKDVHNTILMPDDGGHVQSDTFRGSRVDFITWKHRLAQVRDLAARCDVLNCHGARAAFWARLSACTSSRRSCKIVYTIHGFMLPYYGLLRRVGQGLQERIMGKCVDRFIAVCEAEKKAWCSYGLADACDVDVLYYGLAPEAFDESPGAWDHLRKELGCTHDDIVFMQIARFYWPRDNATLMDAFRLTLKSVPQAKLVLVGDGPWRKKIEVLAQSWGLDHSVIFAGARRNARKLWTAADIAVLSSAGGDGLPIANLEAMAYGKPVITARCNGMPEQVSHGDNGYLYEVGDATGLSEYMAALAGDAEVRGQMGEAGKACIRERFSARQMHDRAISIMQSICAS